MSRTKSFGSIINNLQKTYGKPAPPKTNDPFELILLDNIAYLVDDNRRELAFDQLRDLVGLLPENILAAPIEDLTKITKLGGMQPERRAWRLKECAQILLNDFSGNLTSVLQLPLAKAIKSLKKFPSIGEPGAEKILLFTGSYPILALESNGLRVLLRLGFGEEKKNYAASYKSVKESLANEIGSESGPLVEAHQLLRQHGKETCKSNRPQCTRCVLRSDCEFYRRMSDML